MEEIKLLNNEEIINYVDNTRIFNDEVDKIVDTFNYCEIADDCEVFRGPYPFKCNEVANKEKVETIKTIMNNMVQKYDWFGPQFCDDILPNVSCENNKCVIDEKYKETRNK